ncbi:hypothetical protein EYF80_051440 [Liparis tanakae]|uniref:Uncharacterized protein n=1 Tax=Liparis tanakae TaxID=230148 RepID=A0A4Z2FB41_9TELE|nr:hypothetical protein EYF80_051440 [Liparis tanakae]
MTISGQRSTQCKAPTWLPDESQYESKLSRGRKFIFIANQMSPPFSTNPPSGPGPLTGAVGGSFRPAAAWPGEEEPGGNGSFPGVRRNVEKKFLEGVVAVLTGRWLDTKSLRARELLLCGLRGHPPPCSYTVTLRGRGHGSGCEGLR